MVRTNISGFNLLQLILDFSTPILILKLILLLYGVPMVDRYVLIGLVGGLIFGISAQLLENQQNTKDPLLLVIQSVIKAWLLTWLLLIVVIFLIKDAENFSRFVISVWSFSTLIALIAERFLFNFIVKKLIKNKRSKSKSLIIGYGKTAENIIHTINNNEHENYIAGILDDNFDLLNNRIENIPIIGNTSQAAEIVNGQKFNEVYICLPLSSEMKIKELLNQLSDTSAIIKFVPDLFSFDLIHSNWSELNGIPIININDSPLNTLSARFAKRVIDILLSSTILILISPIMIWISFCVKLSSSGPIIFKQKRYGLNGREIKIYKFRSMTTQDDGNIIHQATKGDPRITPFGAFIRKTSLDELPQFFNVLQGKMSIVGPRPHAIAHNELYRKLVPKYMQRHIVKPGITGWAQINGWRGETDTLEKMEKRVEFDLHYINNWTIWFDFKIIILTILKGFSDKNAY